MAKALGAPVDRLTGASPRTMAHGLERTTSIFHWEYLASCCQDSPASEKHTFAQVGEDSSTVTRNLLAGRSNKVSQRATRAPDP
eukprot:9369976-Ditylum_brightwellii.AAC.1